MNIHYVVKTNEIMSYGYGAADYEDGQDSHFPACKVALVDDQPIDARVQRFDPVTRTVVLKDTPDPEPDPIWQVKSAVVRELADTDKYVLPDFQISETDRAAWFAYRKALRDASKGNDTAALMLKAIPARPDGVDAFERLRS
ncbi:hypothetical protein AC629_22830 [Bradyrhizobium sp. NAS80.1]|uniref:phage tail assembly chaperone n=1 Tax=Bradyrhizobium sp. NAS80.1 TaxID=1680159 RepID=UPI00095BE608|nr:phage tail assembly chaperone [Bradyrhizobium sp. NAS80.1]OKO83379.1 hypothetical protein AC629_22830 [Bradyrhizobium sp. NAS80.1]